MIDHILRFTLPAAYALLPEPMQSPGASAQLLAIGRQESEFLYRRQVGGPARSFWQFERGGVQGVLRHSATAEPIAHVLRYLRYADAVDDVGHVHALIEFNDTLAAALARCLLWTLADRLPHRDEPQRAWNQYIAAWRPGKPHPETWDANYAEAWDRVETRTTEGVI